MVVGGGGCVVMGPVVPVAVIGRVTVVVIAVVGLVVRLGAPGRVLAAVGVIRGVDRRTAAYVMGRSRIVGRGRTLVGLVGSVAGALAVAGRSRIDARSARGTDRVPIVTLRDDRMDRRGGREPAASPALR